MHKISDTKKLNNGVEIPIFGLGVWKAYAKETYQAVRWALELGYRHIDTAAIYGNEVEVGKAIRDSGIAREEIFVTTKLWRDDHSKVGQAFQVSLKKLDIGYIDLYLSHFPTPEVRISAYKNMQEILKDGSCRSIGVSNYTVKHLKELIANCEVVPSVNQVEFHVFLNQKDLLKYCEANSIALEAYSPLAHGQRLNDPVLIEVAKKYHCSVAQIMIAWCLHRNLIVIPKTVQKARLAENAAALALKLSEDDLQRLEALDEQLRTCWDPSDVP
ncbi:MAG: aldo/keto reductase [Oligoflexales bacterium]|nr:aldo/keto reductase [Oligoflexales bacterium]